VDVKIPIHTQLQCCSAAAFADSDGCLSDGGEFYNLAFQRPSALHATIPIVKTEKVSEHVQNWVNHLLQQLIHLFIGGSLSVNMC